MRRLAFPLALLLLAGCGGHGGGASSPATSTVSLGKGKGTAILKVRWPARASARLIPSAANEITVTLLQGTGVVATAKVPRPTGGATTSRATFTGLAYGDYSVTAQAFPNADGSGVAQASGGGSMTVTEDAPGSLGVAMGSTVTSLAILPANPAVGTGGTLTLTASSKDAQGNVVLLAAGGGTEGLNWTSDNPAVATVSGTGPAATLTGVAVGAANVSATMRVNDAGDVVSTSPTAVTVAAATVTVSPDGTVLGYAKTYSAGGYVYKHNPIPIAFQATLSPYLQGSTVTWSTTGGHGSLSSSGVYTPVPILLAPGYYTQTIVATVTKNGATYTGSVEVILIAQ